MSAPWIDGAAIGTSLQTQATSMAVRLGHRMSSWVPKSDQIETFVARCVDCNDAMTVAVRRFRAAPIAGAAVQLWCKKKR